MDKRNIRMIVDIVISVLLVLEMFIQFTGNTLHEVMGFAMYVCFAIHIGLSLGWLRATASGFSKRELTRKNTVLLVMFALLTLVSAELLVSSFAISKLVAGTSTALTALMPYSVWYTLHVVCSYTLCALVLGHVAIHWFSIFKHLHIPYNPERRKAISTCANIAAVAGAAVLFSSCAEVLASNSGSEETSSQDGTADDDSSYDDSSYDDSDYGRPERSDDFFGRSDGSSSESSGSSSSDSDSSTATGHCTLCNKRCPLSSPRCNRPYEAGLIN